MSSEAKIGLGIVLGAVLVSVVLIGRTVTRKEGPVTIGGTPTAAAPTDPSPAAVDAGGGSGATEVASASGPSSTPGTFGVDGSAADRPVPGIPTEGAGGAPADASGVGAASPGTPASDASKVASTEGPGTEVAPAGRTYVVKRKGETLAEISRKNYGSTKRTELIAKANPGLNFKKPLAAGTKLAIPEDPAKAAAPVALAEKPAEKPVEVAAAAGKKPAEGATLSLGAAKKPAAAVPSGKVHRVEAGETLYILADRYLGKSSRYTEILAVNPGMTKDTVLRIGQKVVIPQAGGK